MFSVDFIILAPAAILTAIAGAFLAWKMGIERIQVIQMLLLWVPCQSFFVLDKHHSFQISFCVFFLSIMVFTILAGRQYYKETFEWLIETYGHKVGSKRWAERTNERFWARNDELPEYDH